MVRFVRLPNRTSPATVSPVEEVAQRRQRIAVAMTAMASLTGRAALEPLIALGADVVYHGSHRRWPVLEPQPGSTPILEDGYYREADGPWDFTPPGEPGISFSRGYPDLGIFRSLVHRNQLASHPDLQRRHVSAFFRKDDTTLEVRADRVAMRTIAAHSEMPGDYIFLAGPEMLHYLFTNQDQLEGTLHFGPFDPNTMQYSHDDEYRSGIANEPQGALRTCVSDLPPIVCARWWQMRVCTR